MFSSSSILSEKKAIVKPYQFVKIMVNNKELTARNMSNNVIFPIMDVIVTKTIN